LTEPDEPLDQLLGPPDAELVKAVRVNERPTRAAKTKAQMLKLWEASKRGKAGDKAAQRWTDEEENRKRMRMERIPATEDNCEEADRRKTCVDTPGSQKGTDTSCTPSAASDDEHAEESDSSPSAADDTSVVHPPIQRKTPYARILQEDWRYRVRHFLKEVLNCAYTHLPAGERLEVAYAADLFWLGSRQTQPLHTLQRDPRAYWESAPAEMVPLVRLGRLARVLVYASLSEASCERIFSTLKDITGDDRGSLGRGTQECLVRLRGLKDDDQLDGDQVKQTST
jgi:hypothetical protein